LNYLILNDVTHHYENIGRLQTIREKLKKYYWVLGFKREILIVKQRTFSGGLADEDRVGQVVGYRAMMCCWLDEPTNHLDIESIYMAGELFEKLYGGVNDCNRRIKFFGQCLPRTIRNTLGRSYDYSKPTPNTWVLCSNEINSNKLCPEKSKKRKIQTGAEKVN